MRPSHRTLAVLISLLAAGPAVAPDTASAQSGPVEGARRLSLLGTVVPVAAGLALANTDATDPDGVLAFGLITGGLAAGPALGHVRAGDTQRARRGALVRAALIALTVGTSAALCDYCLEEDEPLPIATFVAGSLAVAIHATRDILAAGRATESGSLNVRPWILPDASRAGVWGTWRF